MPRNNSASNRRGGSMNTIPPPGHTLHPLSVVCSVVMLHILLRLVLKNGI